MSVTEPRLDGAHDPTVGPDPTEELGKRERNKLDKQRRIVAAATELFQEKGFDDTTTAEIASRAEIGAGTLYLYVGSKEDLLVSVFVNVAGEAWNGAFAQVDRSCPLLEQVTGLFLHVTDYHEGDKRLARSFFKELPWVEFPGRSGVEEFVRGFLDRIEILLDDATEDGWLDPEIPRRVLANQLYALWEPTMRRRVSGRASYESTISTLTESFRVLLQGMTPEPA